MLPEFEFRGGDGKPFLTGSHPGQSLAHSHRVRKIFVKLLLEVRFPVKQIQLRRSAGLKQVDHPFHGGSVVWNPR